MYEPPGLPPAGWYPDPGRQGSMRWWSGSAWAAPSAPRASTDDLPDPGHMLAISFGRVLRHWRAATFVSVASIGTSSMLTLIAIRRGVDGLRVIDGDLIGWSNDRLPAVTGLLVTAGMLSAIGGLALAWLSLRTHDEEFEARAGVDPITTAAECTLAVCALARGLATLPRATGWFALGAVGISAAITLIVGAVFVVLLLGVLLAIVATPFVVWLLVKLTFLLHAVVDDRGNPYPRSSAVSRGRFWSILGRCVLLLAIGWAISYGVSVSTSLVSGSGFSGQFGAEPDAEFELDDDGTIVAADLDALATPSTWAIVAGSAGAVVSAVLVTSVTFAGLAQLYRTRNGRPRRPDDAGAHPIAGAA